MREQAGLVVQPLWMAAGWPGRAVRRVYDDAGTLAQLTADNERLRNELRVSSARITRLQTLADDNVRLRALLGAAQGGGLGGPLAPILDIDLDPARQRRGPDAGGNRGGGGGRGGGQSGGLGVPPAPILDIGLAPARQRLVLDAGGKQGVRVGQSVLDAGGLVGQVIEVRPLHATALLLTDPAHAVPVMVARSQV